MITKAEKLEVSEHIKGFSISLLSTLQYIKFQSIYYKFLEAEAEKPPKVLCTELFRGALELSEAMVKIPGLSLDENLFTLIEASSLTVFFLEDYEDLIPPSYRAALKQTATELSKFLSRIDAFEKHPEYIKRIRKPFEGR